MVFCSNVANNTIGPSIPLADILRKFDPDEEDFWEGGRLDLEHNNISDIGSLGNSLLDQESCAPPWKHFLVRLGGNPWCDNKQSLPFRQCYNLNENIPGKKKRLYMLQCGKTKKDDSTLECKPKEPIEQNHDAVCKTKGGDQGDKCDLNCANCAPGCQNKVIGNRICDLVCFNEACGWDGTDCWWLSKRH